MLALLVTNALRMAKLGHAVLEIRMSPADWIRFLVEPNGVLRKDAKD